MSNSLPSGLPITECGVLNEEAVHLGAEHRDRAPRRRGGQGGGHLAAETSSWPSHQTPDYTVSGPFETF